MAHHKHPACPAQGGDKGVQPLRRGGGVGQIQGLLLRLNDPPADLRLLPGRVERGGEGFVGGHALLDIALQLPLEVEKAGEAQLAAELEHRGLRGPGGGGRLLEGLEADRIRVVENVVADAAVGAAQVVILALNQGGNVTAAVFVLQRHGPPPTPGRAGSLCRFIHYISKVFSRLQAKNYFDFSPVSAARPVYFLVAGKIKL